MHLIVPFLSNLTLPYKDVILLKCNGIGKKIENSSYIESELLSVPRSSELDAATAHIACFVCFIKTGDFKQGASKVPN